MASSSEIGSVTSTSRQPTTALTSPNPSIMGELSDEHIAEVMTTAVAEAERPRQPDEQERRARFVTQSIERRRNAATRRRDRRRARTPAERAIIQEGLDNLLRTIQALRTFIIRNRLEAGETIQLCEQPRCLTGGIMRDYQREGLTWIMAILEEGISGILADEMGLGKTVQAISAMARLRETEGVFGPHLVVAPLSTLSNWVAEFRRWAPSIPVVMYHGTREERKKIAKSQIFRNLKNGRPTAKFPVVCTSYEMILKDFGTLSRIEWMFVVIDEGHRMKNYDSKLFQEIEKFKSASRLLITGTPLQNNLKELWSLLHYLLPSVFLSYEEFEEYFDFEVDLMDEEGAQEYLQDQEMRKTVERIQLILKPFVMRRVKADVASQLPKKREYVLYAPMTREQTDFYNAIVDKNVDTRAYLESKVFEMLMKAHNGPLSSVKSSPLASRANSVGPKVEPKHNGSTTVPNDAFAVLMGKTRTRGRRKEVAAPAVKEAEPETPRKQTRKRKAGVAEDSVTSMTPKSAKSSTRSTPGSGRPSRVQTTPVRYRYIDAIGDDDLDDKAFEAKLLRESEKQRKAKSQLAFMTAEEMHRATILELAKKEISSKKLGNPSMQLRLVCNSPHNFYAPWDATTGLRVDVDESIVTSSGKMLLLDRLLPALFRDGHRVLIFSQFKTQLDILEDYCRLLRGWGTFRIDGGVALSDRQEQIDYFNKNPEVKVFLLSTRAAGQGINLASADTVILFDSDWNPQIDLQAQDRAHRIGQTKPVIVYRLVTKGTVEEALLQIADAKRRMEKLVIKKNQMSMGQGVQELDQVFLLKDGQHYKSSGDKEILSEEDLAVLCDRSDAAYESAAAGQGNANNFTVVETDADNGVTQAGTESAETPASAGPSV